MRFSRMIWLVILIGFSAAVVKADGAGADPTIVLNLKGVGGDCPAGVICFENPSSGFNVTLPAGANASLTLEYTPLDPSDVVTSIELLFVNPPAISCQTNVFATCSSTAEVVNGQPALLLNLSGAGPCMSNGVNNPAATCPGDIVNGEQITLSSPDGFSSPETISFVPAPETNLLVLSGCVIFFLLGRKRLAAHLSD